MSDKWIKDRLDHLQTELFEFSTQNRMGIEDLAAALSAMRGELGSLKRENQELKSRLSKQESFLDANLSGLKKSMSAPRKIIRDENGMISRVEIEQKEET